MGILKNFLKGLSAQQRAEIVGLELAVNAAAVGGIPRGKNSQVYIVDPQTGSDTNDGLAFDTALATLAAAEDKCVANQNDVVVLVGGPTGNAVTATLAWDKAYTHLVGLSGDLGLGQRARVTGSATADLASLVTFSGRGCIVRNVQFYNGCDADKDSNAVTVSADNCVFENCFFYNAGNRTSYGRAGSCSLALSGSENLFKNCAIGGDTVLSGASMGAELAITGGAGRNVFKDCRFLCYSETATKVLVSEADGGGGVARWNEYDNCVFQNFSENWATTLTNAFDLPTVAGATTYNTILRGLCQLVGITGWADVPTKIHTSGVAGAGTYGVDTAPST